ncbi:hypothetical protein H2201_005510 [Coniosporium apollinis]|uniref:Uncharacterized protein n=1 Tax=Coniosporium apollinis TaxID=61459 RepID=A0ABQ9NRC5_9PEZI|nr:hypothetical protein H2201_005510 [Coniosporium apollinis]
MYKNRIYALLRCLVHIIPVSLALLLVVLNASGHYIGGELTGENNQDVSKLNGLSFAAKLHELFMLASLTTVIFTYIRRELAFGDGLPFGAVFAGLQFTTVSFLWSAEFFGTIYHEWEKRRKKWYLISLIIVCTLLGVSVGPSSSNLMKPRLEDWPAGGTTFWVNATRDTLFPTEIVDRPELSSCATDTGDASCPYGAWQVLAQDLLAFWPRTVRLGSLPQQLFIPGRTSMRELMLRYRTIDQGLIWGNGYSTATVPNSAISDALGRLGGYWSRAVYAAPSKKLQFRKEVTFTVEAPQPMTFARCNFQSGNESFLQNLTLGFPALGSGHIASGKGPASATTFDFDTFWHIPDSDLAGAITSMLSPGSPPSIAWIDSSSVLRGSQSTLNAVVAFSESYVNGPFICSCSIDTRLAEDVLLTGKWSWPSRVSGDLPGFDNTGTLQSINKTKIFPSAAWARYLNPTVLGENRTIFSEMASMTGLWNSPGSDLALSPLVVESILSLMTANGISRNAYNATLIGDLKGLDDQSNPWNLSDWALEFLPRGQLGEGGSAFVISEDAQQNATMFHMRAAVNGWAYSGDGKTQKVALIVLLLYVLLAFGHLCYSTWTGNTSGAWDTAPEITALAMNSRPTEKLENTGAGLTTLAVFKHTVRVQENLHNPGHVEIVFDDTKDGCRIMRPNRAYR